MPLKQVNLSMPKALFEASEEYAEEFGYRNIQDLILDVLRRKIIMKSAEHYAAIADRMKTGVGVKRFGQKAAVKYLRRL